MAEGRYLLVDVREPNEVAVDAYPGAVVVSLSSFDPQAIPDPKGKDGMRKIAVNIGISNGVKTEVLSGLKEGDPVVLQQ